MRSELEALEISNPNEAKAIGRVIAKLETDGPALGYPHSSAVRSESGLRELRPRAGRASLRVLYCPTSTGFLLLARAPHDRRGFNRAADRAIARRGDHDHGRQ